MIPGDHPRFHSLKTRELLARYAAEGIVTLEGLTAHGRGEAFDYLIGGLMTHARIRNLKSGAASDLVATGIFIFVGFKPNTGIIKGHVVHDATGYFITDANMQTSVPGLFAAGDVRAQHTRQVTTAVGNATTAAIAVEKYLTAGKNGQPAPRPQPMLVPAAG